MTIELFQEEDKLVGVGVTLKIMGVGGAGGNAVNGMIESTEIDSVQFLVANTDAQALQQSLADIKIQLGAKITKGLGAGSNPEIGRRAAEEDLETVISHIEDADILFLTGGLGGGTGSGALPVIAKAAKEMGILTVAIVTRPFTFEGRRRLKISEAGIKQLRESVDTLIVVPNQRLLEIVDEKISMLDAFALSNDILKQGIKGISEIITKSGHINVDFADVKAIMKDMGMALMGTGRAAGENRAKEAAAKAISSPLLENVSIKGARGVLINITGNTDLGLFEINEAASLVYDLVDDDANIILGSVIDPHMGDELMVTVIATGFDTPTHDAPVKEHVVIQDVAGSNYAAHTVSYEREVPIADKHAHQMQINEEKQSMSVHPGRADVSGELEDLDTPTFLRKKMQQNFKPTFVQAACQQEGESQDHKDEDNDNQAAPTLHR